MIRIHVALMEQSDSIACAKYKIITNDGSSGRLRLTCETLCDLRDLVWPIFSSLRVKPLSL